MWYVRWPFDWAPEAEYMPLVMNLLGIKHTKHLGLMIDFDPKRCPKKQIGKRCPKKQIGKPLANNVSNGSKKKGKANNRKGKANKKKNKPAVSSQDERRMLQEGLISKDISDDDLVPFFENDLKASEDNPDVRGIPPGETVFRKDKTCNSFH